MLNAKERRTGRRASLVATPLAMISLLAVVSWPAQAQVAGVADQPATGAVAQAAVEPFGHLAADPRMVDPLLGLELESMRRLVAEMAERLDRLEGRLAVLEGTDAPVEGGAGPAPSGN